MAEEWFVHVESKKLLRPRTIAMMKGLKKRTYKAIGHLKLDDTNRLHIQRFIDNLGEGGINMKTGGSLSVKTQKHYLCFISDVFQYAIKQGIAITNPCRNIDFTKELKKEHDIYTIEEAQILLEALESAPLKYQVFFTLAIYGGYRRAELLGFEWKDIDFTTGVISVVRTSLYTKELGIFTDTTKTKGSQRSIRMPEEIIDLLKRYKQSQTADRLKVEDQWKDTDRLFTKWNGEPMSTTSPVNWLQKFCKDKGLRYVNQHSFRHFNASLLIDNGTDIRTVSSLLGHSNPSTTLNIYAHSFAATQARAVEGVANVLKSKRKGQ